MPVRKTNIISILMIVIFAASLQTSIAANLTPPPAAISNGIPVASMKTLNEIEPRTLISSLPYTITASGSYYLAQPLVCTSSVDGIDIQISEVKIDLNGFSLAGVSNAGDGISISVPCNNITVRNGIICNWGGYGVMATNSDHVRFLDLNVYDNGSGALYAGKSSLVRDCTIYGNGFSAPATNNPPADDGIMVGPYSTIQDCKVYANAGSGIHTFSYSRITGCTATESHHADGIHAEDYCTVRDCTVARNNSDGIKVGSMCRVSGNTCGENGVIGTATNGAGILIIGQNSLIQDNNVCGNRHGIKSMSETADGNLIIRNVASNNTNNYYFVAGDHHGILLTPPPGVITNFNPWANFSVD